MQYVTQSLAFAGIYFSGTGSITIRGKTYNVPPIESLIITKIKKFEKLDVWRNFFFAGFPGSFVYYFGGIHLWCVATIISLLAALVFDRLEDYALFSESDEGAILIFRSMKIENVETIRRDIVKMSDPRYIADMQVGWGGAISKYMQPGNPVST